MKRALLVVDVQNDFMPEGSLPVPEGDQVVPLIHQLMDRFEIVVATQDWHPADHGSFASNHEGRQPGETIDLEGLEQILWPDHCVQGTLGAQFHPEVRSEKFTKVFRKGTDRSIDSYSGFHDNGHRRSTGLAEWLRQSGVDTVFVCGLAADVCVRFTVLDAIREGFTTYLVCDATRGVNLRPGDVDQALEQMRDAGAELIESDEVGEARQGG